MIVWECYCAEALIGLEQSVGRSLGARIPTLLPRGRFTVYSSLFKERFSIFVLATEIAKLRPSKTSKTSPATKGCQTTSVKHPECSALIMIILRPLNPESKSFRKLKCICYYIVTNWT